jgi:hypothetical protein
MKERSFCVALFAAAIMSCNAEGGRRPKVGVLHFPTAAVASRDGRFLYVANSNFNLEFSGALVQAFDLDAIRARARERLADPTRPAEDRDETRFIATDGAGATPRGGAVRVGSYVTALALAPDGRRMYVASRATSCVSWIDLGADGLLECGQSSAGGACDETNAALSPAYHCVGASRSGRRNLLLPPNPTSLDIFDREGLRYITVTHHEETRSRVSLMVQQGDGAPVMAHFAGDFASRLWTQLRLPTADPHWIVFSRDEPSMGHVRLFEDGLSSYVFRAPTTVPQTVPGTIGVVHVVMDPCDPRRARAAARARRPGTSNAGDSILAIDVSNPDEPAIVDQLAMPLGPTRIIPVRRGATCADGVDLYTVLYDARKLDVVDARAWREVAQVRTQVGPVELVPDPLLGTAGHNFLYVVNFSSMCIEVIDATTRQVVFTVGDPVRPRELS